MADSRVQDLHALDRDVRRAASLLTRFRDEARRQVDIDPDAMIDPFAGLRHVASRSTVEALAAFVPSASDLALRDGLIRWTWELLDARVGLPDELAELQAMSDRNGRFEGEPPGLVSFRESVRGAVSSKTPPEARLWLRAAAGGAPGVAAARRHRASRRQEVAKRMGHAHPWDPLTAASAGVLVPLARSILDATEDLSRETFREAADAAEVIHCAVAREAGEGWPARLTPAWLDEVFAARPRGLTLRLPDLGKPLGAASFARALASFGYAFREAATPSSLPFALGHDPGWVTHHLFGWVFGSLASDAEFQTRALGLGRRTAEAQARTLARTALFNVRVQAARTLLSVAPAERQLFEELTVRLFGSPLDRSLVGAFPDERADEPGRLLAMLQTPSLRTALRDSYDVDWFRNPRCWRHLQAMSSGDVRDPFDPEALQGAPLRVARSLEEALG